jgi:fatty-acyl-CoA synthase
MLTGDMLRRSAYRFPRKPAILWNGTALSYRDLDARSNQLAHALLGLGVKPGAKVAMLSRNRTEYGIVFFGTARTGYVLVNISVLYAPEELAFVLDKADAEVLIFEDLFAEKVRAVRAKLPKLRHLVVIGEAKADATPFAGFIDGKPADEPAVKISEHDPFCMTYTGGTTGRPKGVVKTSAANALMTLAVMAEFELPRRPSYLAVAPISHVTGTNVLPVLCRGGTVHLLPRFEPEAVLATIARERINFALLVPTMVYGLLDDPALVRHDLSSLELLLYGASPMSPARLGEALERIGPVFSQLYGQSECYPIAALPKADHDPARPHLLAACGFATSVCHVALLDDALQPVPRGEPGEICVRGGTVMSGYWRQPAQTDEALAGGWLHTGDVARQDEEGRLYIVDRKKDMVVTGGFNVYPREVEDALASHPAVAQAAVFGTPDAKWGEAVKAVVVLRPGQQASADELTALVRERKGALHAPKQVVFVSQLPLTPLGKIDKKALRAQDWAGAGRSIG